MPEIIAIWFFIVGPVSQTGFEPMRLGPMTEQQCIAVRDALPQLPGICKRAIGMQTCEVAGAPWMGRPCPLFED